MWLYTRLTEEQDRLLRDETCPFADALEEATRGEGVLTVALDGRIASWAPVADAAGPLAEVVDVLSDRALTVLEEESRAIAGLRPTA